MTNYVRDSPLVSNVLITEGDILKIEVPHAYSEEAAITPTLDINLMQPVGSITNLDFVTFNEDAPDSTLVTIDTSGATVGVYTLIL